MSDLPALQLPREDEITNYIKSGWHPLKIARTMAKKGVVVSPEQVAELALTIKVEQAVSPLRRHGSDRVTDAHQDMHLLVLAEEERVVYLLKQEQREGGEPDGRTNNYINQLFRHLKELAELEHTLGISPHEATASTSDQPKNVQTLREMLESRTDKTVTLERITVEPR